jgi:pimeloyl-ACP methyl ester carboxylesterase
MNTYQKRRLSTRTGLVITYLLLLSLGTQLAGCGKQYSVKKVGATRLFQKYDQSALDSSKPSWRTAQQLRLLFLVEAYEEDPLAVIDTLYGQAYESQDKTLMLTCAELSLLQAKRHGSKKEWDQAFALYAKATELSYDYLFSENSFSAQNVITPSYRFVAEIYNQSVSKLVEARAEKSDAWPEAISTTLGNTTYNLTLERNMPNTWDPSIFDTLQPTYHLQIKGIKNRYMQRGLGAPLSGYIKDPKAHQQLGDYHPSDGVAYPVTAVMSFGPRVQGAGGVSRKGSIVFYDTMLTGLASIEGHQVPLEADFSTPLGVMLSQMKDKNAGIRGMLHSDKNAKSAGMYMLEPLRQKKIPVIMVHGLMSSPQTWMEMFNDLRGNPEIRSKYQFWFFQYPTGYPINYSASILRKQLLDIWQKTDPDGQNPYFNEAVLIGHSMGGMLSHEMMQDSQDVYWDSVFAEPIESIQLDEDDKAFLKDIFYFEHLPFVKRVVFIATPHRGSSLADKWFTKIGSSMVNLPGTVSSVSSDLFQLSQDQLAVDLKEVSKRTPNSLDHLSPSSNFVVTMNKVPMQADIPYHSIIGVRKSKTGPGSSDGIVPYESSHLDFAVTETLVPSGHSAHMHPLAIAQVKTLLLTHLETTSLE